MKTQEGKEISVKSAEELRKQYAAIQPRDRIILLDHIESSRFIKGISDDFSILVSEFVVKNGYNLQQDLQEMSEIIQKIKGQLEAKNFANNRSS